MKNWIAVCGRPLWDDLNALFHIAVIFTTHKERNAVMFYINFSIMKVFKKKIIIADFFKLSFACLQTTFFYFTIRLYRYIYIM